jgi:uridylate kinase
MKIVLRIGGSVLGSPPNPSMVNRYAEVVSELASRGHSIALVVGGGDISRQYIECAKRLGLSNYHQDLIAIHVSRLNAGLVSMKLGGVSSVPTTVNGMISRLSSTRVAVMGGLKPGLTTDAVAALVAEAWSPDLFIKASNQAGIYTADPKVHKKAKLLSSVSYAKLRELLGGKHKPGIHSIVDPVAVEHLTRHKFNLVVLDGRNPQNILKAVAGKSVGTRVTD